MNRTGVRRSVAAVAAIGFIVAASACAADGDSVQTAPSASSRPSVTTSIEWVVDPPSTSPSVAPSTTSAGSDGPYTEGTTPVVPGTACGAATARQVVIVASGSISCTDALAVMDGYLALPRGDFGNANIREYEGWQCSSPTYATARDLGYGSHCTKGGVELRTPFSG